MIATYGYVDEISYALLTQCMMSPLAIHPYYKTICFAISYKLSRKCFLHLHLLFACLVAHQVLFLYITRIHFDLPLFFLSSSYFEAMPTLAKEVTLVATRCDLVLCPCLYVFFFLCATS